ncbi:MAG: hypothetical protein AB8F94_18180 [Saprospiraceae bacterium]
MKNKILDDIFNDDLRSQLEPNEKVTWDGGPTITTYTKWSIILGGIAIILFFMNVYFRGMDFSAIVYPLFGAGVAAWGLFQSRKIRYLITDKRIIFQLWKRGKKQFHTIHLDEIKKILITDEVKNNGTILLQMKKGKIKPFKTHHLQNNTERPHVSLEMIENVEEVAEYIELGMQKKLLS